MRRLSVFAVLILGGCNATPVAPAPQTDPAVADALADPIMADPQLALQQGGPPPIGVPVGAMPDVADAMPTLGMVTRIRVRHPGFAGCDARIAYGYAWMAKIPDEVALPGSARVTEAAGSDAPTCALRIIRYSDTQTVTDNVTYWRNAARAGHYAVAVGDLSVLGTRKRDGAAYWMVARPASSGTTVDLVIRTAR